MEVWPGESNMNTPTVVDERDQSTHHVMENLLRNILHKYQDP